MDARVESEIVQQGRRLVDEAAAHGLPVRLLGGVAFWLRAGERARELFGRMYPDLDIVAHRRRSRDLRAVLEELGYRPERTFNAMHGATRLLYRSADDSYQVDVFLDVFDMCHQLDLGRRLEVEPLTLPAAELALTKLQIHELNRKDLNDLAMLLSDHELATEDGLHRLNRLPVERLCADDWGLYATVTDNLRFAAESAPDLVADAELRNLVVQRLEALRAGIEAAPKSLAWTLRASIGRRMTWYRVPEEVVR